MPAVYSLAATEPGLRPVSVVRAAWGLPPPTASPASPVDSPASKGNGVRRSRGHGLALAEGLPGCTPGIPLSRGEGRISRRARTDQRMPEPERGMRQHVGKARGQRAGREPALDRVRAARGGPVPLSLGERPKRPVRAPAGSRPEPRVERQDELAVLAHGDERVMPCELQGCTPRQSSSDRRTPGTEDRRRERPRANRGSRSPGKARHCRRADAP